VYVGSLNSKTQKKAKKKEFMNGRFIVKHPKVNERAKEKMDETILKDKWEQ